MQDFKVGDIIIPTRLNSFSSTFCDRNPVDLCKGRQVKILNIGSLRDGFMIYTPFSAIDLESGIEYGFCFSVDNEYELYTSNKIPKKKVDIINFDGGF